MSDFFYGIPENAGNRSERERKVYECLDSLGVKYVGLDHMPAATMSDCAVIEKLLDVKIAKNLFLCNRQKTVYYLLLMPEKTFKTKYLSSQIGSSRLSFAEASDMERLLGVSPGSVSVFGLLNDKQGQVKLLVDSELSDEYIGFHPCMNTTTLKVKYSDVFNVFCPYTNHMPEYVTLPSEQ